MTKRVMRPHTIALAAAGALSIAVISVPAIAQVDAAKSNVTATSKQLGVPMDTESDKFDTVVDHNPANVTASTAKVDIDVTSVDVGSKEYNDELKKKDWFSTAKYPKATFVSSVLKPGAGNEMNAVGKLTIRNIMQNIIAPVTPKQKSASQIFGGTFPVKHDAFKAGDDEWEGMSVVSDDVTIKFRVAVAEG